MRPDLQLHRTPASDRRGSTPEERSDRELLAALADGDERALDELVARKTRGLMNVVHRMVGDEEEARDLVQTAFVRVWEHRERYDGRHSPNTWIYRIATHLAIDFLRSRGTRERAEEPVRHHLRRVAGGGGVEALDRLQGREVKEIFAELAAELSTQQRAAFVLREVEGRATSEVAELIGCRESTVRNHLFHARRALRRELGRRYPEYAALAAAAEEER